MPKTKTPHVHADLIKAWADGEQIQLNDTYEDGKPKWVDLAYPVWEPEYEYRIKPNDLATMFSGEQLLNSWRYNGASDETNEQGIVRVVNDAIEHWVTNNLETYLKNR